MRIIKLNAIDSTNTFLRQLSSEEVVTDYTVVVSDEQTNGRGQMGSKWLSEPGKNLMFSVFKDVSYLDKEMQFQISMLVALALLKSLESLEIPKLSIKWPNDILADTKKIGGILIENVIQNNNLQSSIIGIGINVNQVKFDNLPQASSLLNITGKPFPLDEVMHVVLRQLETYFDLLKANTFHELHNTYEKHLFRKDKPSTFKSKDGSLFSGFIKGVTKQGSLKLLLEDSILKEYNLKDVQLLY